MNQEHLARVQPGNVAILGLPFDENSSYLRGPAEAPPRIRQVLHSGSANLCAENGLDLGQEPRLADLGDLTLGPGLAAFGQIRQTVAAILERGGRLLSLGGDHSVTYPIIQAYARAYPGLNLLQLDAHPDLYDELDGSRTSHACPFARIMEEGLVARLVQVGIRTLNPHQRQQAARFAVEMVTMQQWRPGLPLSFDGPLYLSLDMDVLDPAFAPGVSHHEGGGLSTREVIGLIQRLPASLVGADIVEFNPHRDPVGITAAVAAKLLKEVAAALLAGR